MLSHPKAQKMVKGGICWKSGFFLFKFCQPISVRDSCHCPQTQRRRAANPPLGLAPRVGVGLK